MGNKSGENTQKAISELEKLFINDLIPDTAEEARELLAQANIDTTDIKQRGREIFRSILAEFDDDWRNIPDEEVKQEPTHILKLKLLESLSREELISRIESIFEQLAAIGGAKAVAGGVANRNLINESKEDLASLLRQLEYLADKKDIGREEE